MVKKILIVDDETDFIELLEYKLKSDRFDVSIAENGIIAFKMAKKEKFDLILLDVKMPKQDGVSTFEQLKADNETKNIPVIFITAFPDAEVKKKVMDMGAKDYIAKSYDDGELLLRLNRVLR